MKDQGMFKREPYVGVERVTPSAERVAKKGS
jgi:hypothetical protein